MKKKFFTEREIEELEGWLDQARAGCQEALGKILNACRRYLLAVSQREMAPELRAKAGPSDLVQETFLKAQRHFPCFQGRSQAELLAWLRQMLLHNLEDLTKKYFQADKRLLDREVSIDDHRGLPDSGNHPADQSPSPSSQAIRNEEEQRLRAALGQLPESYRQVIEWYHREHHSYVEIGARLGISADAARKLHHRAVALLTQQLNNPH